MTVTVQKAQSHSHTSAKKKMSDKELSEALKDPSLSRSQKLSLMQEASKSSQQSNKNLSHVPCKFFRQGACQAGDSCPFSHATDPTAIDQPCKYFQRGNCKFGMKCALAHVLPDGQVLNPRRNIAHSSRSKRRTSQSSSGRKLSHGKDAKDSKESRDGHGRDHLDGKSQILNATSSSSASQFSSGLQRLSPLQSQASLAAAANSVSGSGSSASDSASSASIAISMSAPLQVAVPISNGTNVTGPTGAPQPVYLAPAASPLGRDYSIWSTSSSPSSFEHSRFRLTSGNSAVTASVAAVRRSSSSALMPLFLTDNIPKGTSLSESAIVDSETDEDDGIVSDDGEDLNDSMDTDVDFLPDALTDLLTPQELKRRSSKPAIAATRPLLFDEETTFIMD